MKIKKGSLKIILLLAVFTFVVTSIRLLPIKADNFDDYIESNENIININSGLPPIPIIAVAGHDTA